MDSGLSQAIDAVGSAAELARRLGITPAAIAQWERVPPLRVIEVEEITGVSRDILRPDLHPPMKASA